MFDKRLGLLIEREALNIDEAAARLSISRDRLEVVLRGEQAIAAEVSAAAQAFGVSADYLLGLDAPKKLSNEQLLSCLPTVKYMLEMSKKVREYGLLVLRQELSDCECSYISAAFTMLLDGNSPYIVEQVLSGLLQYKDYSQLEKFEHNLIKISVLHILEGANPSTLSVLLRCFFQDELSGEYDKLVQEYTYSVDAYLDKLMDRPCLYSETCLLEDMPDEDIAACLDHCGAETVALALFGASSDTQERFLTQMKSTAAAQVVYELSFIEEATAEQIAEAQQILLQRE